MANFVKLEKRFKIRQKSQKMFLSLKLRKMSQKYLKMVLIASKTTKVVSK